MPAQPTSAPVESVANLADAQISRRTLAKGAAWSVPVIAAAIAAPAAVASNERLTIFGCKSPGGSGPARFTVTGSPVIPVGAQFTLTSSGAGSFPANFAVTGFSVSGAPGTVLTLTATSAVTAATITTLDVNGNNKSVKLEATSLPNGASATPSSVTVDKNSATCSS